MTAKIRRSASLPTCAITKTDGVATAVPGQGITYTITVTNNGPSNVTGATVSDTFPASLTNVSWTCSGGGGGTCTATGTGNISDTVNIPVGGTVTYTVTATVSASATGTLSNTATVTAPGGTTDPTPGNNSATDTDTLTPSADLSITKSDSPDPVVTGSTLTYTLSVSNGGPSTAANVSVSDTLPIGVSYVSATGTGLEPVRGRRVVTCTRASLGVGAAPDITITVTAPAGGGTITNNVKCKFRYL